MVVGPFKVSPTLREASLRWLPEIILTWDWAYREENLHLFTAKKELNFPSDDLNV